ncbi:MAG: heme o synthase [Chloroflexota bacterium]
MNLVRRLSLAAAVSTYFLIVVGAIVRTTGSGLGCPDWPLCHGQVVPPPETAAWIEFSHRLFGAVVSTLIVVVTAASWIWGRSRLYLVGPASAILPLLAIQIGLGAVVVALELPGLVVMVHLGFALVILALLVWVAIAARPPVGTVRGNPRDGFSKLVHWTMAVTFILLLVGGYVRARGAGWACMGFPDCNGRALPFGSGGLVDLHLTHRLLAYVAFALIVAVALRARAARPDVPAIARVAWSTVFIALVQVAIGAIAVIFGPGWDVQTAHVAGASAVWSMVVVLYALTWRSRRGEPVTAQDEAVSPRDGSTRDLVTAYVQLTKPRVMVLLLVTTLAAMLMAQRGVPSLALVFFTLLGGALAAGGAGAINHYLDRDIDVKMSRTSSRPLPNGLIPPENALAFGVSLGVLSFALMSWFVNVLAAALSLLALLFYVFVYTRWLKRSTPLNIVIGGAAGAIPPVVGLAAVTNEITPLAVFLFAIIFIWTPPHFWALALLMKDEYRAAGVPMLPIVKGDVETCRQILGYSVGMVLLTVSVSAVGLLGSVYLISASLLGGIFVYYAVQLIRDMSAMAARRLFRYSILYLALLFVAMVVDRQVLL